MKIDAVSAQAQANFTLALNPYGKLVLTLPSGQKFEGVQPVRAFPIQSPEHAISLLDDEGHEAVWIDALRDVAEPTQTLIREALAAREFIPEIQAIVSVSSFSTPCTWHVRTDRGETQFILKGDEDIRRLSANTLLVSDSHGIQFLIRDVIALDRESRRLLDRFK